MSSSRKIAACIYPLIVACMCACSNTKNTTATRSFHNVTSRYNVVFEARQSYEQGIKAITDNLKVDYTDLPPVYRFDSPNAAQIASPYMDACVEECGKNIKGLTKEDIQNISDMKLKIDVLEKFFG